MGKITIRTISCVELARRQIRMATETEGLMGRIVITGADGNMGRKVVETIGELVPKEELILTAPRVAKIEHYAAQGYDCR